MAELQNFVATPDAGRPSRHRFGNVMKKQRHGIERRLDFTAKYKTFETTDHYNRPWCLCRGCCPKFESIMLEGLSSEEALTTFAKAIDFLPECEWIPDLTEEGIEPNPGPRAKSDAQVSRQRRQKRQDKNNAAVAVSAVEGLQEAQAAIDVDKQKRIEEERKEKEDKAVALAAEKAEKLKAYQDSVIASIGSMKFSLKSSAAKPFVLLLLSYSLILALMCSWTIIPYMMAKAFPYSHLIYSWVCWSSLPLLMMYFVLWLMHKAIGMVLHLAVYPFGDSPPAIIELIMNVLEVALPILAPTARIAFTVSVTWQYVRMLFNKHFASLTIFRPAELIENGCCRTYEILSTPSEGCFTLKHDGRHQSHKHVDAKSMPLFVKVKIVDTTTFWRILFPLKYETEISAQLLMELNAPEVVNVSYDPLTVKERMATKMARSPEINFWNDVSLAQTDIRLSTLDVAYAKYLFHRQQESSRDSIVFRTGF